MGEDRDATEREATQANGSELVAGAGTALTAELRTLVQICQTSVETLAALNLPLEAQRCVASIERTVGLLAKGPTRNAPGRQL